MHKIKKISVLALGLAGITLLLAFAGKVFIPTKLIAYDDANLHYMGRTAYRKNAAVLSWPGASVQITFKGTRVQAILKEAPLGNSYNVIIDRDSVYKLKPDTGKKMYVLADKLSPGIHTVQLYKRTEFGQTLFYGFELDEDATLIAPTPATKNIEFYGNSITCGRSVEDFSGKDLGGPEFENNYLSYASITARHYNADYSFVAKSGIGIMLSWFRLIMPEMYERVTPTDTLNKWNFSKFTPQVVVVNLFQNDSWLVRKPDNKEFKYRFGNTPPSEDHIIESYKTFVINIRSKYPQAYIICCLGNMDATKAGSAWPGYINKAVTALADQKILTCMFPYKGTAIHPSIKDQQKMADQLIAFIDSNVKW